MKKQTGLLSALLIVIGFGLLAFGGIKLGQAYEDVENKSRYAGLIKSGSYVAAGGVATFGVGLAVGIESIITGQTQIKKAIGL